MAKSKEKIQKAESRIIAVESALSKSEQFIEKNKNILFYVIIGILVVVLAIILIKRNVLDPRERNAQAAMFAAEQYFGLDSLNLALNGDGTHLGFLDIIDDYGSTKAGNLAHYYAGVIHLKQGKFEEAIDHLDDFESDDHIIGPMALGLTGDAYLELDDKDNALKYYLKAAKAGNNDFTAPMFLMRAAWIHEMNNDYAKAIELYQRIKKEHFRSFESRDTDKYIARAKTLAGME
jgi:tetratricopeptide (TPR) repeat protein